VAAQLAASQEGLSSVSKICGIINEVKKFFGSAILARQYTETHQRVFLIGT
jgi:hypothetical protein